MKTIGLFTFFFFTNAPFLFISCEKESIPYEPKPIDTGYLLSKVIMNNKLYEEYIYDESNKIVRYNSYFNTDTVVNFIEFEYNNEGKLSKKIFAYGYYETYEYNELGMYNKLKLYNEDNELTSETEFIYNSKNQIKKGIVNNSNGYVHNIYYSYDSKGNVSKRDEYDGTLESSFYKAEYKYDNKNNPRYNWDLATDVIQYNNPTETQINHMLSSRMPPHYMHKYKYDSNGYPVKEYRALVNTEIADTFEYIYK